MYYEGCMMLRTGFYIMSCLTFQAKLVLYRHYVFVLVPYPMVGTLVYVKLFLWDVEAPTFYRQVSSQMAVRFSSLCISHPLPSGRFQVVLSVIDAVNCRAIVQAEGLGELKKPVTSLRTEPMTFLLITYCLNQHCYFLAPHYLMCNV
jgi:hypothetical protein